jgi:hypothetical protein
MGKPSYSSVSLEALPSFLTKTPLGTPCDETVELKPAAEIPVRRVEKAKGLKVSLQKQAVDPARGMSKKLKQKVVYGNKPVKSNQRARTYGFIYRWVYEEVRLSMSKMSIVSLVLGLLFLGTLFFIIGFLAAVTIIGSSTSVAENSPSAWHASNAHSDGKKSGGKGLGQVVGGFVGKTVGKQVGSFEKAVGAPVIVPKSLQPFARYGMGKVEGEVKRDVRQVNPFVSHRRAKPLSPEQQPYNPQQSYSPQPPMVPQQPVVPQQYASPYGYQGASPQNPVYAPPQTAVAYQQPPAISQGGYNQGYALPQQQQVMQQSYYPPPMQQQPYQQPRVQQVAPQQQMMVNPQYQQQYQQQMPPQQGYYR